MPTFGVWDRWSFGLKNGLAGENYYAYFPLLARYEIQIVITN